MNDSRSMRLCDKYIGKYLCWLLSVQTLFSSKKRMRPALPTRPKILVIELFEMGACVMLAPSIKFLKDTLNADIYCLTLSRSRPVWLAMDIILPENIRVVQAGKLFPFILSLLANIWTLRKIKFDVIIDFELFFRITAIVTALLRGRRKAGFFKYNYEGLSRGAIYNIDCAFNQNSHISKNFLALTKTAVQNVDDLPNFKGTINNSELLLPDYQSIPGAFEKFRQNQLTRLPSEKYIVVSPDVGGTLSVRNYPEENYVQLIRKILERCPTYSVLLLGTDEHIEVCDRIHSEIASPACINLAGKTSFQELMETLCRADLLICNDSGIAHFTALTGTPTLSLFSTDSPFIYGPIGNCTVLYSYMHCSPCISALNHKNSSCDNNRCLQVISVETVMDHVEFVFANGIRKQTINGQMSYLV